MNRKSGSGSGLFLMEMIMAVFFFLICASTCILVFVKSNSMSQAAKDTNQGVILSQSIAEVWKAEGAEGLAGKLDAVKDAEDHYVCYRDSGWRPAQSDAAVYTADILLRTEDDGMSYAAVAVRKGEKEIYALEVSRYDCLERRR